MCLWIWFITLNRKETMKRNKPHLPLSKSLCLVSSSLKGYRAIMPLKINTVCSLPCVKPTSIMTSMKKSLIYRSQIHIFQWQMPFHKNKISLTLTGLWSISKNLSTFNKMYKLYLSSSKLSWMHINSKLKKYTFHKILFFYLTTLLWFLWMKNSSSVLKSYPSQFYLIKIRNLPWI